MQTCPKTAPFVNVESISGVSVKVCRKQCVSGFAQLMSSVNYNIFECKTSCGSDSGEWKLFTDPESSAKICTRMCVAKQQEEYCQGTIVYSPDSSYKCGGRMIKLEAGYFQCILYCLTTSSFPSDSGALYDATNKKCANTCPRKKFKKVTDDGECLSSCSGPTATDSNY